MPADVDTFSGHMDTGVLIHWSVRSKTVSSLARSFGRAMLHVFHGPVWSHELAATHRSSKWAVKTWPQLQKGQVQSPYLHMQFRGGGCKSIVTPTCRPIQRLLHSPWSPPLPPPSPPGPPRLPPLPPAGRPSACRKRRQPVASDAPNSASLRGREGGRGRGEQLIDLIKQ